jgi:hypothetical protein
MTTYLQPEEARARLPLKVGAKRFRADVIRLGLCLKHGHQIVLTEDHLARYIERLQCPGDSSREGSKKPGRSKVRKAPRGEPSSSEQALAKISALQQRNG